MKGHRTNKIVLLVFFVLYALSPLTYDLSVKSITSDPSRGTSEQSFHKTSLYLIEALYEAVFPPDEPKDESLPNRILIKKKSIVRRGRPDLVSQSGRIAVFAAADPTAGRHFSIRSERSGILQPWLMKNRGCLPRYPGLSPPLLS